MSYAIRVALIDPGYRTRESLKQSLHLCAHLRLELECPDYAGAVEQMVASCPDVILLDLDHDPSRAIELISLLNERLSVPILATSHQSQGTTIMQAIRAGVREVLTIPAVPHELITAVERVCPRDSEDVEAANHANGQVIAVWGASGGVGASTLAVNLAATMVEEKEPSVGLIDLDLAMGDLDVLLDLIPERSIMDLIRSTSDWDLTLLRRCFVRHESGINLLPHPIHLDEVKEVHEDFVRRILVMSRSLFRHNYVDISKNFHVLDQAVLRDADSILLVTQLDLPCLRNVVRILLSLRENYLDSKVKVIVNRVGFNSGQIGFKRAEETLGREIFWQIPNDFATAVAARNQGVPLVKQAPHSTIATSFRELAARLGGQISVTPTNEGSRRRWFGLRPSRA